VCQLSDAILAYVESTFLGYAQAQLPVIAHFKKKKSLPCEDRKVTILAFILSTHNLPIDRAGELFKPSTEAKRRLGSVRKKSGTFGFKHFSL